MKYNDKRFCGNEQRIFRARHKITEPGVISHVTQRAAGKEPLFIDDTDYLTMLMLLKESVEKFDLRYYALSLMANHTHILLEPREKNLPEAMRSIFSRYAAKFNTKYQRKGHLFGGPYRQSVCLDNTYLLTASIYIHLNPVRAGIVDKADAYRWSSASLYCGESAVESFVDPGVVLRLVHDQEPEARKNYRRMLEQVHGHEPENALEHEGAIEKFCIRLAQIFPGLFKKLGKKTENTEKYLGCNASMLDLARLEQVIENTDFSRSWSMESRKAKKYIVEQLLARGFKKTEIAGRLGISRRSVYNIINSSCD
ncbi:transposase [Desulfonatronovibrio magnus]|uniref:transposase n=1 Tax=Desulfonatronovibrio magnus TaxID=698827 RepID=UPI0005EBA1A8|nr:transposase [Desulfonatronovibrio magnus]